MRTRFTPTFAVLAHAAALVLAALTAVPAAAQVTPDPAARQGNHCPEVVTADVTCKFQGATVQFGGSPAATVDKNDHTITLTAGWVWVVSRGLDVETTKPVTVKTSYATAGAGSARRRDDVYEPKAAFLLGYGLDGVSTDVTVALVAGGPLSNLSTTVGVGCQVSYTSDTSFGSQINFNQTVKDVLAGIGVTNIPAACTPQ
jgi:hypothetical protein